MVDNLKAEGAGVFLDIVNVIGQRTGIRMDALACGILANSASLQKLRFSARDSVNFLGNVEILSE